MAGPTHEPSQTPRPRAPVRHRSAAVADARRLAARSQRRHSAIVGCWKRRATEMYLPTIAVLIKSKAHNCFSSYVYSKYGKKTLFSTS